MASDPAYRKLLNEDDSAHKQLKACGYASGGAISDERQDKRDIAKAVHKHESHLHRGEPETKLARGGHAGHGSRKPVSRTNVIVEAGGGGGAQAQQAAQQGLQAGRQQGLKAGVALAAQRMGGAGRPPMPPGAGPGGPPPMAPPPAASMGAKRGGKVGKRK